MNPTLPVIVLGAALTVLSAVQAWLLWRLSRMVAASAPGGLSRDVVLSLGVVPIEADAERNRLVVACAGAVP